MTTTTTTFGLTIPTKADVTEEDLWADILEDYFNDLEVITKTARDNVSLAVSSTHTGSTADRNKILLCDASGGAFNVNLVAAATAGTGFALIVKKTDSSANAITIDANGTETIDGATTYTLDTQYQSVLLICDGSNWHIAAELADAIEFASAAETLAGTEAAKALTPAGFAGNKSLATSGYYKLPGGLIMQWGFYDSGAHNPTITFPTAFSTATYSVTVTLVANSIATVQVQNVGLSSFEAKQERTTDGLNLTNSFYWMAVGV